MNLLEHCAIPRAQCGLCTLTSLRCNQIDHCLRLGQIHLSIQKGPAGKLPRPGLPHSLGKEGLQFDRDLELLPFPLQSFGDIEVLSRVTPPGESLLSVRYVVTDDYVIAMACTG